MNLAKISRMAKVFRGTVGGDGVSAWRRAASTTSSAMST